MNFDTGRLCHDGDGVDRVSDVRRLGGEAGPTQGHAAVVAVVDEYTSVGVTHSGSVPAVIHHIVLHLRVRCGALDTETR